MFFIYIIFTILAIIIIIILIKIKAVIKIDNFNVRVTLILFGIIKIQKKFTLKREQGPIFTLYQIVKSKEKKITSLYDVIQNAKKADLTDRQKFSRKKATRYLLDKASFNIQVRVDLGIAGAYTTAMISGLLSIISATIGAVYRRPNHKLEMHVHPLFSKQFISIQANCIIMLSVANIIIGYIIYKKNMRR